MLFHSAALCSLSSAYVASLKELLVTAIASQSLFVLPAFLRRLRGQNHFLHNQYLKSHSEGVLFLGAVGDLVVVCVLFLPKPWQRLLQGYAHGRLCLHYI